MSEHSEKHINAGIAAIRDQTISPEQAADVIAEQCRQALESAPTNDRVTQQGDTPWLENFLWVFWSKLVELAQEDSSVHDRTAHVLAALKAKGSEGCEGWRVWGSQTSWAELPLLGPVSREEMNGPQQWFKLRGTGSLDLSAPKAQGLLAGDDPTDDDPETREVIKARQKWLNLNAFLAQLWALGVVDEAFFGICSMAAGLEPLTLSSTRRPTREQAGVFDGPQELQIEVASVWLRIAGARMYACREILGPKGDPDWDARRGCPGRSGGTWDGVDGYHPDRWRYWKGILQEVAKGEWRMNVIKAAQAAVDAMNQFEREAASA
ncbi:hypothetical protein BD309DRAFT_959791 [Dichomitus squalens]|uniref:Uncharacterized protein n=1 Tax=Dichomitus squalens TaxID=114155 RepID=A0A4V6MVU3_9APHY|nr:hypothetical protein BD311DRAFT_765810 [Dichomitus squalens]TBU43780.1 hypothetical protein BD309DRAFT_959791 [Dichomitus squalens]TBU57057.1 hypothetical protein BD310DRAFT_930239 [Dichomitus squalens]